MSYPVPDSGMGPQPATLVIARHGHEFRHLEGNPFVWRWMFQNNGKQVAMETGPLHFSVFYLLIDLTTGKQIDSYQEPGGPAQEPAWVEQLDKSPDQP